MRFVALLHRWLGIFGCLLFIAWFASGIVMMYARMPELSPRERLGFARDLDLAAATLSPADAAARHRLAAQRATVTMVANRPAYRFLDRGKTVVIFSDTGERFEGLTRETATAQAQALSRDSGAVRYDARIDDPDQWTLQSRALLPLHRIELGGGDVAYFSDVTGQLALITRARDRSVAYAGAVLHWLYFTPLRKHGSLWNQTIIGLSIAGSVTCLLGLVWGLYTGWASPYRGWMKWHHYSGLVFGLVSFTWVFSGLLSMDPWDWHPGTAPTRAQRDAFSGGPLRLDRFSLDRLRDTAHANEHAKEIELAQFNGEPRLIVDDRAGPPIDPDVLLATARRAMPGVPVADSSWLESYDSYYYGRGDDVRALPVLRVRFADAVGTWLYIDPARGAVVRKEERLSRLNRWLYHGLHSLDFPWLYRRRPLWDIVVIILSVGGIASAVTSIAPAWRRLRRHAQHLYT
jgi:hypothetical protein